MKSVYDESADWLNEFDAAGLALLTPTERAEWEEYSQLDPRSEFGDWLRLVSPSWSWDWPHLAHVRDHLERVTSGDCRRLAIVMPPQHGKSQMATVRYPVWRIERNPGLRAAVACYNQTHANRFSRRALKIAQERGILLDPKRSAVEEWETTVGGGLRAVGVGAGITGNPVDLLVIDDPVKSHEEANSEAYRERVWDWYTDDLYTRLQPGSAVILIMTHWHDDDLFGRIRRGADAAAWEFVILPAEAEENDPLGRPLGAALCPERYDEAALAERRRVLGTSYYGLYQGRPVQKGGGMVKLAWLVLTDASSAKASRVRYWDKAATANGGCYSCGVLMSRDTAGLFTVEDVIRGQWSSHERNAVMLDTAKLDRQSKGHVAQWVEQEPGSGGKESAEITVKLLAGFDVRCDRVTGDKETRLRPFAAQAEAGNVRVVLAPWSEAYRNELASFPAGTYQDQADATGGAFNKLTLGAPIPFSSLPAPRPASAVRQMPAGVFGPGR